MAIVAECISYNPSGKILPFPRCAQEYVIPPLTVRRQCIDLVHWRRPVTCRHLLL